MRIAQSRHLATDVISVEYAFLKLHSRRFSIFNLLEYIV